MINHCLIFFFVFFLINFSQSAFIFEIKAKENRCVYEYGKRGVKIMFNYFVVKGGFMDIDLQINDPNDDLIYAESKKNGQIQFIAKKNGYYSFCFDNSISTITSKMLSFDIHLGGSIKEAATKDDVDPVESGLTVFKEKLTNVADILRYLKIRERICRLTNNSTKRRALWWPILENLILIAISFGQVNYITTLFKRKK